MKYEHDRQASEEILRLLIQKMAEHPAAFTPQNYAVWYEYVTGINPALSETLVRQVGSGERLDDTTIEGLYLKYVSECNMDVEWALREDIQHLLRKLAESTIETEKQAYRFDTSLHAYGDTLKQNPDPVSLSALIKNMADDTSKMIDSMQDLQSELAASKQKVEKLHLELHSARGEALIDPLTGILNRRGFENSAKIALSNQAALGSGICLLMVDIDHFKTINDTYGHLFGDKVIRAVANTLKSKVRGQDSVGRMGGEEFALLLAETDISGACTVAENMRKTVEGCQIHRVDAQEKIGGITISVGVAEYVSGNSLLDLLGHADKALYASKKQGRNRTTVYADIKAL
ncbi:diguanylate cyclase VdcA [mine drainage metagenome]|uniref:Diguanylate cyclase VdcA n=1 Tax=mine drainage metagenome TaxID=410659 RepID=A0A1J5SB65_9ZZZZ